MVLLNNSKQTTENIFHEKDDDENDAEAPGTLMLARPT